LSPDTLERLDAGDPSAVDALAEWVYGVFGGSDPDLAPEVLLQILRRLTPLSGPRPDAEAIRSLPAWIHGVAAIVRLRRSTYARRARTEPLDPEDASARVSANAPAVDDRLLRKELRESLVAAMRLLPAEMRFAIYRVEVQGASYAEVSRALYGRDDLAAYRRTGVLLTRARKRLRELLRPRLMDP
jgi:DNA-directed RNA polymerase specialized sigma24 family protein